MKVRFPLTVKLLATETANTFPGVRLAPSPTESAVPAFAIFSVMAALTTTVPPPLTII